MKESQGEMMVIVVLFGLFAVVICSSLSYYRMAAGWAQSATFARAILATLAVSTVTTVGTIFLGRAQTAMERRGLLLIIGTLLGS